MIPGTLAKEVVIGSLGTIYGTETKKEVSSGDFKTDALKQMRGLESAFVSAFLKLLDIHPTQPEAHRKPGVLQQKLKTQFASPLAAFSYMVFILLYIP